MGKDYYSILGLSKTASEEEIKKAYRKKALQFHPDKNQDANAEERFKEIGEAYEILSDSEKRILYDGHGSKNSQQPSPHTFRATTDPFDLFRTFFGGRDPFADILASVFAHGEFCGESVPGRAAAAGHGANFVSKHFLNVSRGRGRDPAADPAAKTTVEVNIRG